MTNNNADINELEHKMPKGFMDQMFSVDLNKISSAIIQKSKSCVPG